MVSIWLKMIRVGIDQNGKKAMSFKVQQKVRKKLLKCNLFYTSFYKTCSKFVRNLLGLIEFDCTIALCCSRGQRLSTPSINSSIHFALPYDKPGFLNNYRSPKNFTSADRGAQATGLSFRPNVSLA